jgi:hypothetical protein
METKQQKKQQEKHGAEIKLSAINPLKMWTKLGLGQDIDSNVMDPQGFDDEESKMAYEAFKNDFRGENQIGQGIVISSKKGSIFIWSLLKACSKRSPTSKLSSKKILFKDKLFINFCKRMGELKRITFNEKDFEDISIYLENKNLIERFPDAVRFTQHFTDLFHEKYNAWLDLEP